MKALKNDEKYFLFHVKSSSCSSDIYIFVLTFFYEEKRLDKKATVTVIYGIRSWTTNNYNTHIVQYHKK